MTPGTVACQAPLSMGFPREEYWGGLPFPSPRDLPNPGIETVSSVSPAWQVDYLPVSHLRNPEIFMTTSQSSFIFVFKPVLITQQLPEVLMFLHVLVHREDSISRIYCRETPCSPFPTTPSPGNHLRNHLVELHFIDEGIRGLAS